VRVNRPHMDRHRSQGSSAPSSSQSLSYPPRPVARLVRRGRPLLAINEHGTRGHLKPQFMTVSGRRLVPRRAVREPDAAFPRRREMAGGNMHGLAWRRDVHRPRCSDNGTRLQKEEAHSECENHADARWDPWPRLARKRGSSVWCCVHVILLFDVPFSSSRTSPSQWKWRCRLGL